MHKEKTAATQMLSLVALFAALNVVFDSLVSLPEFPSGVWYSWGFLIEPLTGVVLGPLMGFASTLVGVMIGHYINFIDVYEFLFTLGAPIGAAVAALLFKGKWKIVLSYYSALFVAYFVTPVSWHLPLWGMWDTYVAFAVLLAAVFMIEKGLWNKDLKRLPFFLAVSAFVGLEADVLFRIFVLVPGQTYSLFYNFEVEVLAGIWGAGAIITPIKVALSTFTTVMVGPPLIRALKKTGFNRLLKL